MFSIKTINSTIKENIFILIFLKIKFSLSNKPDKSWLYCNSALKTTHNNKLYNSFKILK